LWLGHESIQTTHGYIEADLAIKEQAGDRPFGEAECLLNAFWFGDPNDG